MNTTESHESSLFRRAIELLAHYRCEQNILRDRLTRITERLNQDEELVACKKLLDEMNAKADKLDAEIRMDAIQHFDIYGDKKPHPALSIKVMTELDYDDRLAMAWCQTRLPNAIKLDRSVFEKHARAVFCRVRTPRLAVRPLTCITSTWSQNGATFNRRDLQQICAIRWIASIIALISPKTLL